MSTLSLFKSQFSPKKAPPRKTITISPLQMDASERAREFGLDYSNAYMILGDQIVTFDPEVGEWFSDTNQTKNPKQKQQDQQTSSKEINKLQKGNQQLQEENNLLRVKNELLLDMIAEVYSEMKLENEKKN